MANKTDTPKYTWPNTPCIDCDCDNGTMTYCDRTGDYYFYCPDCKTGYWH